MLMNEAKPGQRISLIILILVTLITLIAFDRPLVRGDGVAYLAWIDTLVLDQDVNFNNQHDRLLPVVTYQIEWSFERERWVNIFPFGIAFVQAPFYLIGHAFHEAGLGNYNPDYFHQMQGVGLPYSFWLMIGANMMTLTAVIMAWRAGLYFCDVWTSALIAFAAFVGTPLLFYSTVSPVNSHNPGAFAVACFVSLLVIITAGFGTQSDEEKQPVRWPVWACLGIVAGLMILVRWQLALVAVAGWAMLVFDRQKHWNGLAIATATAVFSLIPLPLIWNELFGASFLVPFDAVNDEPFMQTRNHSWEVLRETLLHSPVILISLLGILALWRRDRRWALLAGGVIVLQVYVNGSALDWNAGASYGMRRMSELYIVYAILAAAAGGWVIEHGRAYLGQYAKVIVRGVILLVILYSFLYFISFLDYTWTNPDHHFSAGPVTMIEYFLRQPNKAAILWEVYRTHVGPLAWSMPGP